VSELELRLRNLVRQPREDLHIEVKGWLDLGDENHKADLAKALLALANHGGGYVLIGFSEQNGQLAVDEVNRPSDLNGYSQDLINGVVKSYADPPFHCTVHFVPPRDSEDTLPVIVVPGGHRVPIRCRRDSPSGRHTKQNAYYIRRPGPSSEQPGSAKEWEDLLRRCLLAGRDDLLNGIRLILQGAAPSSASIAGSGNGLDEWVRSSEERFREVLAVRLPKEEPSRFSKGFWTLAYEVKGYLKNPSLAELKEIIQKIEGHETGWPAWLVMYGHGLDPYPYNDCVECFLGQPGDRGGSHSDFWRVSRHGKAFLLRGYQEDDDHRAEPGTVLDFILPVWRIGECLLHSERFAAALSDSETTTEVRASWKGLAGRIMVSWAEPLRSLGSWYKATQDEVTTELSFPSRSVSANLPELVKALVAPLYEVFNFLNPPDTMYAKELERMRKR